MEALKKFATFLKANHLTDLAKANIEIILPMNVPLMKYFEHLPEDELLVLTTKGLEEFLTDIENDNAINKSRQNLVKWENNTLEGLENINIEPLDLVLVSTAQNRALLRFTPKFTDDPYEIFAIADALADHYTKTQEAAFEVLFRIRKKEAEALAESEERFRSVSQSATDGLIIFDLDLKIEFWNEAAENIFGYTQEEMVNSSLIAIHPSEKQTAYIQAMQRFKKDKKSDFIGKTFEMECIHKNGSTIPVEMSLSMFETSKGSFFSIIVHNITERKKAAEELAKQARELAASNEELEHFAYVASHDLKEPLRMVSNYVQLLGKKFSTSLDEETKQYMGFALSGTERMRDLITDLLEYSRISHAETRTDEMDLKEVVEDVIASLSEVVKESGAEITYDHLPVIYGDSVQISQLFQNLIGNGIKFTPAGRKPLIQIGQSPCGNNWQFSIKDNGIGISHEFKDKLFKMFQRLHSREEYPGTGIGLAVCKKIVERHNGSIWFESEGEGSTFFFTLPMHINGKAYAVA